jgi:hypothetical protein
VDAARITTEFLDELVERTDRAGGPGTPGAAAVWAEMSGVVAPDDLARFDGVDPFGEAYSELQLELWARWSGREYDPTSSESTGFDAPAHLASRTAYGPGVGAVLLSHHYLSVTRAVSALGVDGGRALEFGAGWGLQAEVLSEIGFDVDVVDVNPAFLDLIARRLQARGFGGRQIEGTFTDFTLPHSGYDLVYTYEALHHTPRPLETIRRFVDPTGAAARCLAFVGEPVVDMWPAWGLRIDQESLYCIRKFGWFESGWTDAFILSCVARVGLGAHLMRGVHSVRDIAVLGAHVRLLDPTDPDTWTPFLAGWSRSGDVLMSHGESSLAFAVDDGAGTVALEAGWYNPRPTTLELTLLCGEHVDKLRVELSPGISEIVLDLPPGTGRVVTVMLDGETWCPRSVLGTADQRRISSEIRSVRAEQGPRKTGSSPISRQPSTGLRSAVARRIRRRLYDRP